MASRNVGAPPLGRHLTAEQHPRRVCRAARRDNAAVLPQPLASFSGDTVAEAQFTVVLGRSGISPRQREQVAAVNRIRYFEVRTTP